jgi:Penicillin-insensitive murein endopeptidase
MTKTGGTASKEVTQVIADILRALASAKAASPADSGRLFFPEGIDYLSITVKVAGSEVALVVAGPKSKPGLELGRLPSMVLSSSTGFVQLPQGTTDYNTYSSPDRQFGTPTTIATVGEVAVTVHGQDPKLTFSVGDISFADGSPMPPHKAHRLGRNVDVRPLRMDRQDKPVTYSSAGYDRAATGVVIAAFLAHPNVSSVIFNDTAIPGVKPDPSGTHTHDNHFHVQTAA